MNEQCDCLKLHKHGDILEQTYAEFLSIYLPAYEHIWSEYIGNDGNATLSPVLGLSEEEQGEDFL